MQITSSSRRTTAWNALVSLLAGLGILMVLFGIGMDILPNSYPGLGLPQILLITAGLSLSLIAFLLWRTSARRRVFQNVRSYLVLGGGITVITLIVLEFVLAAVGVSIYFSPEVPETYPDLPPYMICDEPGCHYVYDVTVAACENGELSVFKENPSDRPCIVNRQGFHDTQDFVADDDFNNKTRILMLGDSFTYGRTAEIGKSYVETVESNFPESIIWNTGMHNAGTSQALASFRVYAPILQPHLTVLGFYMNDFNDNMLPTIRFLKTENVPGRGQWYQLDGQGNAIELDHRTFMYRKYFIDPPASEIEWLIGKTRLGSLALKMLDVLRGIDGLDITREYLTSLRDSAAAQDTALLVLLIPQPDDIGRPGHLYQAAVQLMKELEIPYLNPIHALDAALDYMPKPDIHWNTAGHQKIGAMLGACLSAFQIGQDLADCERVEMPRP